MIILITGGIKSGKSRRALDIVMQTWRPSPETPVSFITTAEALGDEMKLRIKRHQEERLGLGFTAIEGMPWARRCKRRKSSILMAAYISLPLFKFL